MNLQELLEKRAGVVGQMKAVDQAAPDGVLTPEQRAEWDRLDGEVEALNGQIERAKKLELLGAELKASTGTLVGARGGESRQAPTVLKHGVGDNETRAWAHYLRTGDAGALGESRAYNNTDMNIGTSADGGYAVPTGLYNQIIARRDESALFGQMGVRSIPGQGLTVRVPIDNEADVLFTSLAEANQMGQDAPALYYKDFTLVKYAKYISLSWELLRDEDANLLSFVNDWVGRGIAATENSVMVTEVLANGTAGLSLDAAAAVGAGEIPELVGKVAPEYQDGAVWLLAPGTVAYIQGLAGTNNWYFAPVPAVYAGRPSLWGYPVFQSSFCSAVVASAKSLVFGNFNFLGRRQGTSIQMLRDPYTKAEYGQIRLWFWFDVVYGVLQAEAIQYATHPSA